MTEPTLHIVFGLSPAGVIRHALSNLGRREEVLDLADNFSLGPIASDDPEARGLWLNNVLGEYDWREIVENESTLPLKTLSRPLRIIAWYAPNRAESFAGFHWWLSQIDRTPCSIVSVPDLHFNGTEAMMALVDQETALSESDRDRHQAEWQRLKEEDAPLRIIIDSRLASAPLDYFDDFIIDFVLPEWQSTMRVVGEAFSTLSLKTGHSIDALFTFSRLRALSASGAIEWEGGTNDMRSSKVRLASNIQSS